MTRNNVKTFALTALLFGSTATFASWTVGHPTPTTIAPAKQLTFTKGSLSLQSTTVDRCNGKSDTFTNNEVVDLVAGDTIVIPSGNVCGLTLTLSDDVTFSGTSDGGGSFDFIIDVGEVILPVSPMLVVTNTSNATEIRFASENWVTEYDLGIGNGSYVLVDSDHSLHDHLRDQLRNHSAVLQ